MRFYTTIPYFLINAQRLQPDTTSALLLLLTMFLSLCALLIALRLQSSKSGEGKSGYLYVYCLISILAAVLLIFTKGFTITALKGFLLFLILLKASLSDIKTGRVPDYYSIMILLIAFIQAELSNLPSMLFGLFIVALPQIIVMRLKPSRYGGADIKITASAAFLLGVSKGLFALFIGELAVVLIPSFVRLLKKQPINQPIRMIPYLSSGIFLAFIL